MNISRSQLNQMIYEELQEISEGWFGRGKKKSKKVEDSEEESKKKLKKAEKAIDKTQSTIDRLEKSLRKLKEVAMGQLPERYVGLIYKWLKSLGKESPHNVNKMVNFIQNSETNVATKYLIQMAKEVRFQKDTIDAGWPSKKEFTLSDEWQEVPKGTVMPPGAEYRMDLSAEKTFAKLRK